MIWLVERAQDEALAEALYFQEALEEEKEAAAFQWIQGHRTVEIEKTWAMKS